jgi:ATP-binding cassette, subfamily B (MDR/TAP), member 1
MFSAAQALGMRKAPVLAGQYAISFIVLLAAYGFAFWYGTKLLLQGEVASGGTIVM